jgi:hypothetical protein
LAVNFDRQKTRGGDHGGSGVGWREIGKYLGPIPGMTDAVLREHRTAADRSGHHPTGEGWNHRPWRPDGRLSRVRDEEKIEQRRPPARGVAHLSYPSHVGSRRNRRPRCSTGMFACRAYSAAVSLGQLSQADR